MVFAVGDRVYAVNLNGKEGEIWQAYRPGAPLIDPDDPEHKRVIGHQVDYLGDLRLEKSADVSTLHVLSSKEEIGEGADWCAPLKKPI